jgi:hypothetical protein
VFGKGTVLWGHPISIMYVTTSKKGFFWSQISEVGAGFGIFHKRTAKFGERYNREKLGLPP